MMGEGKINVADVRGHYSHCKAIHFDTAAEMNAFFEEHQQRLVVDIKPQPDGGFLVLYTGVLTEEEIKEFQEVQEEARRLINERKKARLEEETKREEEKHKQELEAKRLQEVGRKCEQHHKPLIEEKRDAKKGKK